MSNLLTWEFDQKSYEDGTLLLAEDENFLYEVRATATANWQLFLMNRDFKHEQLLHEGTLTECQRYAQVYSDTLIVDMVEIFINGQSHRIASGIYDFRQICSIADASQNSTVLYKKGLNSRSGILIAGRSVEICDGMSFTIVVTNNA